MKLVIVPAYWGAGYTPEKGHIVARELLADMEAKGQLEGVEIDIDDGYPFPEEVAERFNSPIRQRNEEFFAYINLGIVKRVKELSESDKYDAIVQEGDLDPGFWGARYISKVPFVSATHAAIHVASLIGEQCCLFAMADWPGKVMRRQVENYGFSHKVVSIRPWSLSSIQLLSRVYEREERSKVPEVIKGIDNLAVQCIEAIEKDRIDTLIFSCAGLQMYANDARQALDKAGYGDIPIITSLSAAIEMAKVMVNMKLTQAPRAYLSPNIQTAPEFR